MSPKHFDVVIVGGAAIGSSVAYFLSHEPGFAGTVAVIERDPAYARAATTLSAAAIRQQFSTRENIRMSRFGIEFIKNSVPRFGTGADFSFREGGYLLLAGENGRATLEANHALQVSEGADIALMNGDALAKKFPWLVLEGVAAGAFGRSGEGWFDAHSLLANLRNAARKKGVVYIHGEVAVIKTTGDRAEAVRLLSGETIACDVLVNAAGPQAGEVAALAGINLPVEPRKRCVFVVACRADLAGMPLLVDTSGVWLRPEGEYFICGVPPPHDPRATDFDVDYPLFDDVVWPALARRIPAMEKLKLVRAWAGHYDFNSFDQNAVLGPHPQLKNFIFANGFSGHGLQHAPAGGRAVAELIVHRRYVALDLSVFRYDRIAAGTPLLERNVI